MSLGFPTGKVDIDARSGQLCIEVRDVFVKVTRLKAYLDSIPDATLTGIGYTAGEVTTLRAAIFDLDKLGQVATAAATQASANDFFFNAKKLTGLI